MGQYTILKAIMDLMVVFKRMIFLQNPAERLILSLYVLLTYNFDLFDAIPYLLITGPPGTGKTRLLKILFLLCNRAFLAAQITPASFNRVMHNNRGTLIMDEAEGLQKRRQKDYSYSAFLSGYQRDGRVVTADKGGGTIQFNVYGPKIVANTGGVVHPALKSRFITITMVEAEERVERFFLSRHGKELEEVRSNIENLFKDQELRRRIQDGYENFEHTDRAWLRDDELWAGFFAIIEAIDEEPQKSKLHNELRILAERHRELKRAENFFTDWNLRLLFYVWSYLDLIGYDPDNYIIGEDIKNYVSKQLRGKYVLRTETVGRELDNYHLLVERKVKWIRKDDQDDIQKTCYRIDLIKLRKMFKKYRYYIEHLDQIPHSSDSEILLAVGKMIADKEGSK